MSEITSAPPHNQRQRPSRPASPAVAEQNRTAATPADGLGGELARLVYQQIQQAAQPVAVAKGIENLIAVDEQSLGDLPWFHNNGTNFNAATYDWLNKVFAYNPDGYVATDGTALTTAYANVVGDIAYGLDPADEAKLNAAIAANAALADTVITDYTSAFGPVAGATQVQQFNNIMATVLGWGATGVTLAQLRSSTNPIALLPNAPLGSEQLVNDLLAYLTRTSAVADLQNAGALQTREISDVQNVVNPPSPPTTAGPGLMITVSDGGATQIVPAITIAESVALIQNNLLPASGTGSTFTASFVATSSDQQTAHVSVDGLGSVSGSAAFFLSFGATATVSYNLFQFASDLTSVQVSLTFNGVTTFTPSFAAYDISTRSGWWYPSAISQAANAAPDASGYRFTPAPPYQFGRKGNFGAIGRLLISQQPVISLTYQTSHFSQIQQIFQETVSWSASFLGIPLGGGSQSYYKASLQQHSDGQGVTVTMNPVGAVTAVTAADQRAYVVGAEMIWPGASH